MGMAQASTTWTGERVRALPDDGLRYELVDGELLVTPSPGWTHQSAVAALFRRLDEYVGSNALGWVRSRRPTSRSAKTKCCNPISS